MTVRRGYRIVTTPCCGARYALQRYLSINFGAFEHWTDGWREFTVTPNDEGLRQCRCGRYVLLQDLVDVDVAQTTDLPHLDRVYGEDLLECIAKADDERMELAARVGYWHHLNHPYRDVYREHSDAREAASEAAWNATHPDRRTL